MTARFRVGTSLYIFARTSNFNFCLFLNLKLLLDTAGEKGSYNIKYKLTLFSTSKGALSVPLSSNSFWI